MIDIYTTPKCTKLGEGSWGFVIEEIDLESRTITENKFHYTTSDTTSYARMALQSTIDAMNWCNERDVRDVVLHVDEFVFKGLSYWLWNWRRDWRKCKYHQDLWEQLEPIYSRFEGKLEVNKRV